MRPVRGADVRLVNGSALGLSCVPGGEHMAIKAKDYFEKLPEGRRRAIEERVRELQTETAATGPTSPMTHSDSDVMRHKAARRHDVVRQGEDCDDD